MIGKSTVARVCQDTRERCRRWCERRLDEHDLVYLFCDALYLKLRPDDAPAEGVLVAWGVTLEGRKVLLGLALGSRESYENWLAFGRDLVDRGMRSPALIVADGAPGLWKAARELWPGAEEQRCTVHALRNVTGKLPERHHRELKAGWWQVFDDATSAADARRGLDAIVADYRATYPSAMAVITGNLDALVAHLRWPTEHRKRIRSTNLLERTFVEVRRRTKVIGRFPGETSALSLDLGRAGTLQPRLARRRHDPPQRRRHRTSPPPPTHRRDQGGDRRLASTTSGSYAPTFTRTTGRHHELASAQLIASLVRLIQLTLLASPTRNEPNHGHSDQDEVEPCR